MSDAPKLAKQLAKKLAWRCRRGSKELDLILGNFLQTRYPKLSAPDQRNFARLLECPDPQLNDWLCKKIQPDHPDIARLVKLILSANHP